MRLYRAHRHIHGQDPPDRTSISLNLVAGGESVSFRNQYRFDLLTGRIAGPFALNSTEAMRALLPDLGGAEGADLLDRFATHNPCDRIRFGAVAALAGAAPDLTTREAVLAGPRRARTARWRVSPARDWRRWRRGRRGSTADRPGG